MHLAAASISARAITPLPNGQAVEAWALAGSGGLTLEVLTYGGIVTRLLVPDRLGKIDDVVLGFSKPESYFGSHPYFGAITGRVAGRLTGARFSLDGITYRMSSNEGVNHLHGGFEGFDKKIWNAEVISRPDGAPSLRLNYSSPDGEEGYPGKVHAAITYTVLPDNTFQIDTQATADAATPFCPTHHSYFNLGGANAGSIADHQLEIFSDQYSQTDEALLHVGRRSSVKGEPNDFNRPRLLGEAMPVLRKLNGDMYLIRQTADDKPGQQLALAARVSHASTGRVLTVLTNEQYLQLYTSSAFDGGLIGKSGRPYARHAGICLNAKGIRMDPITRRWAILFFARGRFLNGQRFTPSARLSDTLFKAEVQPSAI